jgi:hypothetical protein
MSSIRNSRCVVMDIEKCSLKNERQILHIPIFIFWFCILLRVLSRSLEVASSQQLSKMFIHIYLLPLHVSAFVGHLQAEYTINYWKLVYVQQIHCSACFIYIFLAARTFLPSRYLAMAVSSDFCYPMYELFSI